MAGEWEFKDYVFTPREGDGNIPGAEVGSNWSLSTIREYQWADGRSAIMEQLQSWFVEGWEPITPIGSDCLVLEVRKDWRGRELVWLKEIRVPMRRKINKPQSQSDVPTLIAKLAELKDAGVITPEEFEAKKSELLKKI